MKIQNRYALFGFAAAAVTILALVLLITQLTAGSLEAVLGSRTDTDARRTLTSYLHTQVRAHDAADCIRVQQGMLVLSDEGGAYETRIYSAGGMLVEDYAAAGSALRPDSAVQIAACEEFSAQLSGGLLRLKTDDIETLVHIYSAQTEAGS